MGRCLVGLGWDGIGLRLGVREMTRGWVAVVGGGGGMLKEQSPRVETYGQIFAESRSLRFERFLPPQKVAENHFRSQESGSPRLGSEGEGWARDRTCWAGRALGYTRAGMWVRGHAGTRARGYAGIRVRGYMGLRVYGFAGIWVCGYMGLRVCGFAGIWVRGGYAGTRA